MGDKTVEGNPRSSAWGPSPPPAARSGGVHLAAVLVIAAVVTMAFQYRVVQVRSQGHFTGLFRIGDKFYSRGPTDLFHGRPYVFERSDGFDGQFFFYLAHDPLLLHGVERFLDAPRQRSARVGYPILAYAASLGSARLVPPVLYLVNMLALLGCVALLGQRWRASGLPAYGGLLFVLCASTIVVATTMTCEVVTAFFLLLGFWGAERTKKGVLLASVLCAVFCKEAGVLWWAALVACAAMKRDKSRLLDLAALLAPYAFWLVYLRWRIPEPDSAWLSQWGLGWPLKGAFERLWALLYGQPSIGARDLVETGLMLCLLSMAFRGLRDLAVSPKADAVRVLCGFAAIGAICTSGRCWEWSGNYARLLFLLPMISLWDVPRRAWARVDTYGYVALSVLGLLVKHG